MADHCPQTIIYNLAYQVGIGPLGYVIYSEGMFLFPLF